MSDTSRDGTERTARYSDPITERGGWVGRGAVLYDTREPHARPCCARPDGRCLAHVVGVYEETSSGQVYYKVADGTWTTEEWIHGDDLLAIFEPAGWSVTNAKPTYILTREHGVEDHHDLMTDGGTDYDYEYPDYGPECCVDGCTHQVPGLKHGYEPSTREGVACNDCWGHLDENGHWPDDDRNIQPDTDRSGPDACDDAGGEQA